MSVNKRTVTTVEVTIPGAEPGQWVTTTTQTIETEETLRDNERPTFGAIARHATQEQELPPL